VAAVAGAMTLGVFATHAFEGDGTVVALDESASTEDIVADNQMAKLVRKAVENLPPPEDEIIRRYYVAGERMDDIAADLGKSKSWVSRVHTKAIARLGARLRGPRG
jgi:RNA polymerase sigma factor for flagellar operon FliA